MTNVKLALVFETRFDDEGNLLEGPLCNVVCGATDMIVLREAWKQAHPDEQYAPPPPGNPNRIKHDLAQWGRVVEVWTMPVHEGELA